MGRRRIGEGIGWRLRTVAALVAVFMTVAPPASAYIGYGHDHDLWGKFAINEQFSRKASEVYNRFGYYQDTWSVQNPIWRDGYCWNSGFPGWNTVACGSWYAGSGPSHVGMVAYGEYHWTSESIDYQSEVYGYAQSDNTWQVTCYFGHGGYPPNWWGDCTGGRWG